MTAGFLAFWRGDFTAAPRLLQASLSGSPAPSGFGLAVFAQCGLGAAASGRGEHSLARSGLGTALADARDIDDRWVTAFARHFLAHNATNTNDVVLAISLLDECIDLLERLGGNEGGVAYSLSHLGRLSRRYGEPPIARRWFLDALRFFTDIGDMRGIAYALVGLAGAAVPAGEVREAAQLFGATDTLRSVGGPFREVETLA